MKSIPAEGLSKAKLFFVQETSYSIVRVVHNRVVTTYKISDFCPWLTEYYLANLRQLSLSTAEREFGKHGAGFGMHRFLRVTSRNKIKWCQLAVEYQQQFFRNLFTVIRKSNLHFRECPSFPCSKSIYFYYLFIFSIIYLFIYVFNHAGLVSKCS